jgi:hypothetical protein
MPKFCPEGGSHPRPLLVAALLGAAVADTALEIEAWDRGLLLSVALAILHVNLLRYAAGTSISCTTT